MSLVKTVNNDFTFEPASLTMVVAQSVERLANRTANGSSCVDEADIDGMPVSYQKRRKASCSKQYCDQTKSVTKR